MPPFQRSNMIKQRESHPRCWIIQGSLLIPLFIILGQVNPSKSRSFDLPSKTQQQQQQQQQRPSTTTSTIARNVRLPNFPWEWSSSNRTGIYRDDVETSVSSESTAIEGGDDDNREEETISDWDDFDQNALERISKEVADESDTDTSSSSSSTTNTAEEQSSKEIPGSNAARRSVTFPESSSSSSLQTPVVYRYYGRNRARLHSAGSIPFILLGPSVDHWKNAAQLLAARGFSVIACERVLSSSSASEVDNPNTNTSNADEEGTNVVLAILDALRWSRVVLVGCDRESALAMQAALQLAPQRIAGLVLCGDLQEAYQLVASLQPTWKAGRFALDYFLQTFLESPFTIIWDGELQQGVMENDVFRDTSSGNRCLILGGGLAPHRRRPEQFAWALTRFVEQKVAPTSIANQKVDAQQRRENETTDTSATNSNNNKRLNNLLPMSLQEMLSPGTGLLVSGRVVASIIFYVTALRVALYQYENLRMGLMGIKSKYDTISSLQRRVLVLIKDFFVNFGYLHRLWRLVRPRAVRTKSLPHDDDDNDARNNEIVIDKSKTSTDDKVEKDDEPDADSKPDDKEGKTDKPDDDEPSKEYHPEFRPSFFLDQVIA